LTAQEAAEESVAELADAVVKITTAPFKSAAAVGLALTLAVIFLLSKVFF
jgi:hypothetical protein